MRRTISAAALAAFVTLANAAAAFAQSDPTRIGDNVKKIIQPNVESFWWVALVIGVIALCFARKANRAGGLGIALLIAGVVIFNPSGVQQFMQSIAHKIV